MTDRLPGFSTLAVHAGAHPDPTTGAVVTPICLATTFAQQSPGVHKVWVFPQSTVRPH